LFAILCKQRRYGGGFKQSFNNHGSRLFGWLDEAERNKIVREVPAGELQDGIGSPLAFVYRRIGKHRNAIEQMVERAGYQVGAEESSQMESVSVEIDITVRQDIDEIDRRDSADPGRLTPGEIGYRFGRINSVETISRSWLLGATPLFQP
jgi:hypothetical protein